MNKHIYIQPKITISNMDSESFMESSVPVLNPSETFNEEEKVGSRSYNTLWDDDDFED